LTFSNYRVTFNNISVVDPLYTLPFLVCLIVAMFYNREQTKRRIWVKAGIYISSIYVLFTLVNKIYVDSIFKESFDEAAISYGRFSTQPTIMNNVLWCVIVEAQI